MPNLILSELEKQGFTKPNEIAKSSHFSSAEIQSEIKSLQDRGQIQKQGELLCLPATWQQLKDDILTQIQSFHQQFPYKPGLKGAELAGRLQAEPDLVQLVLEKLEEGMEFLVKGGIDKQQLVERSFITPCCTTATLAIDHAEQAFRYTKNISHEMRQKYFGGS